MRYKITVTGGDGIGPEVTKQAWKVLVRAGSCFNFELERKDALLGGASIEETGLPITDETVKACRESDAVFLGAVGADASVSPWYRLEASKRPEAGLLALRKALGVFANLRPAKLYGPLKDNSPLRSDIRDRGIDLMIIRELTGGLYFGERQTVFENGLEKAVDTLTYTEEEIRRIAEAAFTLAGTRSGKVTLVDKANVLDSSRLWRKVVSRVASRFPDIRLEYMLVDNCAMQLVRDPSQFDVILTENMFGDILSDEAGMITGSIGMLPSASLNENLFGLYEPCHGAAPDLAGTGKANPLAAILSAAMMLRYSLKQAVAADAVEKAVEKVLNDGYRTPDICSEGMIMTDTERMGSLVADAVEMVSMEYYDGRK